MQALQSERTKRKAAEQKLLSHLGQGHEVLAEGSESEQWEEDDDSEDSMEWEAHCAELEAREDRLLERIEELQVTCLQ
jgi:hypothetical protein